MEDLKTKLKLWERIYYPLWRRWSWFTHIPWAIKYFLQRVFRGWDDTDLWDLDYFIVSKIRKPLKAFIQYQKKNGHGCPEEFFDEKINGDECIAWIECLKKMERTFDLLYEENTGKSFYGKTAEQVEKDEKEIQEGLGLFIRYLRNLWD